jgi:restriction system protein
MINFIGRQRELKLIEDFVFKTKTKVLYINGIRGIGKTSLVFKFLELHKKKISDDYYLINGANQASIQELDKIDKHLLILDEIFEDVYISSTLLRNLSRSLRIKKIIIITNQIPSLYDTDLSKMNEIVQFLELKGLERSEILTIIRQRLGEKEYQNFIHKYKSDFLNYFENNPKLILTSIDFINNNKQFNFGDFKSFIETPLKQNGIVDLYGNPISVDSAASKKIEHKIKIVNSSLVDKAYKNPDYIFSIKSHQFEELVAELLEREGFDVNLTKKTHDGGKDIFIANNSILGNFLFYIECKQYSPDFHVGVKLVRELFGTVTADRATAGLLVTTSYFSKEAINFVENVRHQMSLKNFLDLKQWINNIYLEKYGA